MKKLALILATLLPTSAWAHEGHNGVGLFHHLQDILPIVCAVMIVAGYFLWKKTR